ncbi:MAG TPA: nitroreductase family deazaflavin-dependent oxidoreductase [Dehalococcoidia bacterium]|nr:nitroreductase family deazaflavin-dependent oxidoreductase [Dehalococcoidia bacterium]
MNRMLQRWLTGTHVFWYRLSSGRIGGRFGRLNMLLLTTTGRRSGRPWTTPLTYLEDGDEIVIVASNGGAPGHPRWYLNLRANPQVTVELPRRTLTVKARTATPEEKARLWPMVVALYSGYADYQRRTEREIPLVILPPEE